MTISKIEKHLPTQRSTYLVIKAKKSDKKDIQRFYKAQRYAAGFIGHDHAYFIKHNTKIIACVIISAGQESGLFWLLHGLVIDSEHRGSGIASILLRAVIAERLCKEETTQARYDNIICFTDQALATLYLSNKFVSHNTAKNIAQLPDEFRHRFLRYKENHKSLCCYLYSVNFPQCA